MNNHYHNSVDDDNEKLNPDWFICLIVILAKKIESLQLTYVHINPHIKSQYHSNLVEMYILINIIIFKKTLYVHMSVM